MRKYPRIFLHLFLGYTAVAGTTVVLFGFWSRALQWTLFPVGFFYSSIHIHSFILALAIAVSCLVVCEYALQVYFSYIKKNPWATLFLLTWMGCSLMSLFVFANHRVYPNSIMVWFNSLFVFSIFLARFQKCFSHRSLFYQWLLGIVFLWPNALFIVFCWNEEWGPLASGAGRLADCLALFAIPLFFVIPGLFSPQRSKILCPVFGLLTIAGFVCFTNRPAMMFLTSGRWELLQSWNPFEDPQLPVLIGVMVIYPALVIVATWLISWFLSRWGERKEIASDAESVRASVD